MPPIAKPRICIVAPYSLGLVVDNVALPFGGAEIRAVVFAKGLARGGSFEVSLVVSGSKQDQIESGVLGLRVLCDASTPLSAGEAAASGTAFPRVFRFWRRLRTRVRTHIFPKSPPYFGRISRPAWEKAEADVYCIFGASDLAAELAMFAGRRGKAFVLFLSSDSDASDDYKPGSLKLNAYGSRSAYCHFSIVAADAVIAQTGMQAGLVRTRFAREACIVPNPLDMIDLPPEGSPSDNVDTKKMAVIWIGKSDLVKCPQLFVDLARRRPTMRFLMVLNNTNPELHARICASAPPNLTIIDRFSRLERTSIFRGALALVNTSAFEGFPNTFLEAGQFGVPILSLNVDPDRMLSEHGCGVCANGNLGKLAEWLDALDGDPEKRRQLGEHLREYVRVRHDPEVSVGYLSDAIAGALQARSRRAPSQFAEAVLP